MVRTGKICCKTHEFISCGCCPSVDFTELMPLMSWACLRLWCDEQRFKNAELVKFHLRLIKVSESIFSVLKRRSGDTKSVLLGWKEFVLFKSQCPKVAAKWNPCASSTVCDGKEVWVNILFGCAFLCLCKGRKGRQRSNWFYLLIGKKSNPVPVAKYSGARWNELFSGVHLHWIEL